MSETRMVAYVPDFRRKLLILSREIDSYPKMLIPALGDLHVATVRGTVYAPPYDALKDFSRFVQYV